jgi:acyl-CoA synthetase (AMP-forming)/AMP-acid ligase II
MTELLLGHLPEIGLTASPDQCAVDTGNCRLTYRELDGRINACAKSLIARDVAPGDRVATLADPGVDFLVTYLAAARVGAMWVGLNPVQKLDEYRHVLGDCGPKILFAASVTRGRNNRPILAQLTSETDSLAGVVTFDGDEPTPTSYSSFIEAGREVVDGDVGSRRRKLRGEDGALIVYTSGSTGRPKGAVLTQSNIYTSAVVYSRLWPRRPLTILCNLPISHVACCVETVAFAMAAGGTIVFQEHFDAKAYLSAIERERVTFVPLVPTMFQRIVELEDWQRYDTSSLETILFGGAAMPTTMIEKLLLLGRTVVNCWGMTETTSGITFTDPDDPIEVVAQSVGRPVAPFEVSIIGEDGQQCPQGESGEIVVRGPCVFSGYFGRPEATAETMTEDGWLKSGDLGRFDEDGRLHIVGRIKEMFKSGGYNVYPREVEGAIESFDLVAMAVVVPVADPLFQEVGHAFVVPKPAAEFLADDILAYCRGRLANYKVPKRIFIRRSLPMLPNGKIDRASLAAEAAATLASDTQGHSA